MLSYCFKCRENTESKNSKVVKTKKGAAVFSSNCALYDSQKLRIINKQEANGLIITILGR